MSEGVVFILTMLINFHEWLCFLYFYSFHGFFLPKGKKDPCLNDCCEDGGDLAKICWVDLSVSSIGVWCVQPLYSKFFFLTIWCWLFSRNSMVTIWASRMLGNLFYIARTQREKNLYNRSILHYIGTLCTSTLHSTSSRDSIFRRILIIWKLESYVTLFCPLINRTPTKYDHTFNHFSSSPSEILF